MNYNKRQLWKIIESLFAQLKEEKKENDILRKILKCHLPELGNDKN